MLPLENIFLKISTNPGLIHYNCPSSTGVGKAPLPLAGNNNPPAGLSSRVCQWLGCWVWGKTTLLEPEGESHLPIQTTNWGATLELLCSHTFWIMTNSSLVCLTTLPHDFCFSIAPVTSSDLLLSCALNLCSRPVLTTRFNARRRPGCNSILENNGEAPKPQRVHAVL